MPRPHPLVRAFRSVFGYRKTSLTLLVCAVLLALYAAAVYDAAVATVPLPRGPERRLLHTVWRHLEHVSALPHPYAARGNDAVRAYIEAQVRGLGVEYDTTPTRRMHGADGRVSYHESNNVVARVNGSDPALPHLLLSAHFDSVAAAYGATDAGVAVAALLGVLEHVAQLRPRRTVVFNFNNHEEHGLEGAHAFLSHPWRHKVRYFLNLEGTGAGGKAALFRGTDHGVVSLYRHVRFPFASSLFQQGFSNGVIHSETDYHVYSGAGLRGLDVAFYRPRDVYHTAGDSIKNIGLRLVWHMLATALDYTQHVAHNAVAADSAAEPGPAAFWLFSSYFVAVPVPRLRAANWAAIAAGPVLLAPLALFVVGYRRSWTVGFVNAAKFPVSLAASAAALSAATGAFVVPANRYLANSAPVQLLLFFFAVFLLANYAVLNAWNAVFRRAKGHHHDEKLVLLAQTALLLWAGLVYSTVKLAKNRPGSDHTGEFLLAPVFLLQAAACAIGLLGWLLKRTPAEAQPLLAEETHDYDLADSASAEFVPAPHDTRSFGYDWLVQFLVLVPAPSVLIFHSGYLALQGLNKNAQETLRGADFVYTFLQAYAVAWAVPLLPFVFKLNRIFVLVLLGLALQGAALVLLKEPFDAANPLKTRFIQNVDLDKLTNRVVYSSGATVEMMHSLLARIPSAKTYECSQTDVTQCEYPALPPHMLPGVALDDYVQVEVLKNSLVVDDSPFGLLTGEIEIRAPKNRICKLAFAGSDSVTRISSKEPTVKSVIVHRAPSTKDGFSRGRNGDYVYKDANGISELMLNKLSWDEPYHVSLQWVPRFVGEYNAQKLNVYKLSVEVTCYWADLEPAAVNGSVVDRLPAYSELLHYLPSSVSLANRDRGLLAVSRCVEL